MRSGDGEHWLLLIGNPGASGDMLAVVVSAAVLLAAARCEGTGSGTDPASWGENTAERTAGCSAVEFSDRVSQSISEVRRSTRHCGHL